MSLELPQSVQKLRIITSIVLIGFILAIFYHGLLNYFGFQFPWNTFLFQPWDRFMDFFHAYTVSKDLDPYHSSLWQLATYFPLTYLLFYPVTWISDPVVALLLFFSVFCYFLCWQANHYLQPLKKIMSQDEYNKSIIILCFLSYPTLICLDRGNLDAILIALLGLFLIAFLNRQFKVAALLLAIPVAMKLYPLVFLVLFWKEKRYAESIFCLVLVGLLSVLALWCFHGSFLQNLQQYHSILSLLNRGYGIYDGGFPGSISLFSLLKVCIRYSYFFQSTFFDETAYRHTVGLMMLYYTVATFSVFAVLSWYVCYVEREIWKQVMVLSLVMILFPNVSQDYRLIFIFIPLLLYIISPERDPLERGYTVLFGLLLIPKNYFILPHMQLTGISLANRDSAIPYVSGGYSVMSLLNVIILLIFLVMIVSSGLRKQYASTNLQLSMAKKI